MRSLAAQVKQSVVWAVQRSGARFRYLAKVDDDSLAWLPVLLPRLRSAETAEEGLYLGVVDHMLILAERVGTSSILRHRLQAVAAAH